MSAQPNDENEIHVRAGNIINDILLAHKKKWNGNDEIQDMLAEAFVRGVAFERDENGTHTLQAISHNAAIPVETLEKWVNDYRGEE